MLPRNEFEISESIRNFWVALAASELVGCSALHLYSPVVGEIRSLAVREEAKTHMWPPVSGDTCERSRGEFSLACVFAFTYVADFFRKVGFDEVERGALPLKVWKDCVRCPKLQSCDEIAMIRVLKQEKWLDDQPKWGYSITTDEGTEAVQLPVLREQ
jgi:amino-acid N-acetyltransferase